MPNFTPDNPPKSGDALRLWRWWKQQTSQEPRHIAVCRPGLRQRQAGAASYIIQSKDLREYLVYSVADTIKTEVSEAQRDRATGDYVLS